MAAARQLFQTDGLAATTSAIAQAAGVGEGTLYLYFASKEDLMIEVFRDDVRRIWNDASRSCGLTTRSWSRSSVSSAG